MEFWVSCRNRAIWQDMTSTALFGTIPIPFCCSVPLWTLGPAGQPWDTPLSTQNIPFVILLCFSFTGSQLSSSNLERGMEICQSPHRTSELTRSEWRENRQERKVFNLYWHCNSQLHRNKCTFTATNSILLSSS